MNRYDQRLSISIGVALVFFVLTMTFGFITDERIMGLQISFALIFIISSVFAMLELLFRE